MNGVAAGGVKVAMGVGCNPVRAGLPVVLALTYLPGIKGRLASPRSPRGRKKSNIIKNKLQFGIVCNCEALLLRMKVYGEQLTQCSFRILLRLFCRKCTVFVSAKTFSQLRLYRMI